MKVLVFGLILASCSAFASGQDEINQRVDSLLAQIRKVKLVITQTYIKEGQPNKEKVCSSMEQFSGEVVQLVITVVLNSNVDSIERKIIRHLSDLAGHSRTFCEPKESIDPNLKIYNFADLNEVLSQISSLAHGLRKEIFY